MTQDLLAGPNQTNLVLLTVVHKLLCERLLTVRKTFEEKVVLVIVP